MRQKQMQEALEAFVADCGYETVHRALKKLRPANIARAKKTALPGNGKQPLKPRARKTAVAIVESLKAEGEHGRMLMMLAKKYDAKDFMPNVGSVRSFLEREGADISRVKSRQQVTVAVFKRLAGWDVERLRDIDDGGWYAAHQGLAPIARAIENFERRG